MLLTKWETGSMGEKCDCVYSLAFKKINTFNVCECMCFVRV